MEAMRALVTVLVALVVVTACGRASNLGPPSSYRLYEAVTTQGGPVVDILDSRTHATLAVLPLGTASTDWKHYYGVRSGVLEDIDPRSGEILHELTLSGSYDIPRVAMNGLTGGLSQNGQWLVLEAPASAGQSHLLVVDTSFAQRPAQVDLQGTFEFDGISNDGARLFLLEYLSVNDYRVRFYNVPGGFLDPTVVVDKFDPSEPMTGRRLATVSSVDGQWQFTVYARAKKGAFIHALMMGGSISLCLDLPGAGWSSDTSVFEWSLALSPDGTILYAANPALGQVVEVAAAGDNAPAILGAHSIAKEPPGSAASLGSGDVVVSPDGKALAIGGAGGLQWIDTATMGTTSRALPSWAVASLGLSPDGRSLYAVRVSGEVAELSPNGSVVSTFDPQLGRPMALMRVEGS